MKKYLKILVIVLIILVVIALSYYTVKKVKQNKEDKEILNGMTGKQFIDYLKSMWYDWWKKDQSDWILKTQEFAQINSPKWRGEQDCSGVTGQCKWQYTYEQGVENRDRGLEELLESYWKQNPRPIDSEFGYNVFLAQNVDDLGIDITHPRVQELLKQW